MDRRSLRRSSADRRTQQRARIATPMWVNKYIGGFPHLAEILDVSAAGLLIRTIHEPSRQEEYCPLEVGVPGSQHRMWLWARSVRRWDNKQALRLVHAELFDRAYLAQLVRWQLEAAS